MPLQKKHILAVVALLGSIPAVFAQSGIPSLIGAPLKGTPMLPIRFGSVNLTTGNLHLDIPIASVPERGIPPTAFLLVYDSLTYGFVANAQGNLQPTRLFGSWNTGEFSTGYSTGSLTPVNPTAVNPNGNSGSEYCNIEQYNTWNFVDSNGTSHPFSLSNTYTGTCYLEGGAAAPVNLYPNGYGPSTASGYALDNSGYFLAVSNGSSGSVYSPDGTLNSPTGTTTNGNQYYTARWTASGYPITVDELQGFSDPSAFAASCYQNGALLSPSFPGYSSATGTTPVTCNLPVPSWNGAGGTLTYVETWENVPICTAFFSRETQPLAGYAANGADICTSVWVLQSLQLPGGQGSYSFSYDQGTTPGHYGELTGITLPTGGTVSYSYTPPDGTGASLRLDVQSVTDQGGTTSISISPTPHCQGFGPGNFGYACAPPYYPSTLSSETVTVTRPPHPTDPSNLSATTADTSIFAWSPGGGYEGGFTGGFTQQDLLAGVLTKTTTVTGPTATPSSVQVAWAQTGTIDLKSYTYANSSPSEEDEYLNGTLYRKVTVQFQQDTASIPYLSVYHMSNYPALLQVFDGGGNLVAKEIRTYDEYGASYCSGISMLANITGASLHDDAGHGASFLARGNPTTVVDYTSGGGAVTTHNCYDTLGNVTASVDGNGHQTTFSYVDSFSDHNCIPSTVSTYAFPTTVTDAVGHQTKLAYNSCSRSVVQSQGPNDIAHGRAGTQYSFDAEGRPLQTSAPDGGSLTHSYPSPNEVDSVTAAGHATKQVVNGYGQPSSQIDVSANSEVDTTYDQLGRVQTVTNPHAIGTGSAPVTAYALDGFGRSLGQLQPDGVSKLVWQYSGPNVDTYDEAGSHHHLTYDGATHLTAVFELGTSATPLNLETDYTYDALNNLRTVVQKGTTGETARTRSFSYDWLSRLLTAQNPESGLTCYGVWSGGSVGSGTCQNGYDGASNLVAKTDANGTVINYSYDAGNRMKTKIAPSDYNTNYTYTYDTATNGIGYFGSVSSSVNSSQLSGASVTAYDNVGRIANTGWMDYASGSWKTGIGLLYDRDGNLSQLTYPDGRIVSQHVDQADRLTSVTDDTSTSAPITYLSGVSYYPSGQMLSSAAGNGVTQAFTLNPRLQLCHYTASSSALPALPSTANLLDRALLYATSSSSCANTSGNNRNIAAIVDNLAPGNTQSFGYDGLNRLKSASQSKGWFNQTFNYDSFGNMTPYNNLVSAGSQPSFSIDPSTNRMAMNGSITSGYLQYDAAGRLTQAPFPGGGLHSYMWTAESFLRGIDNYSLRSYLYDGLGNRSFAVHGSTWKEYVYLNGQVMAEYDASGTFTDYIYANGQKLARVHATDAPLHLTGVTCGNCGGTYSYVALTSGAGRVIQSGDVLSLSQYAAGGAAGGVILNFTDGTRAGGGNAYDQSGQQINCDGIKNQWLQRHISLAAFAGKILQSTYLINDTCATPGQQFDIFFNDVAISGGGTTATI